MAGNTLGEEIYTAGRYLKHPPGSGTNDLGDGMPLDAGSVQIVDNDLAVCARENVRHLVWDVGFGLIKVVPSDAGRGYAGDDDTGTPDASEFDDANAPWASISWDYRVARHYGPFWMVDDRGLASPATGYGIRSVTVDIDCISSTGSSLVVYAALTAGLVYPSDSRLAIATSTPAAGRQFKHLTLTTTSRPGPGTTVRCRPSSTTATPFATPLEVYLWVGWRGTTVADGIVAVSAYEIGGSR